MHATSDSEPESQLTRGSLLPDSPVYRLLQQLSEAVVQRLFPRQAGDQPVVVKESPGSEAEFRQD